MVLFVPSEISYKAGLPFYEELSLQLENMYKNFDFSCSHLMCFKIVGLLLFHSWLNVPWVSSIVSNHIEDVLIILDIKIWFEMFSFVVMLILVIVIIK